jgi:hypothetical protein
MVFDTVGYFLIWQPCACYEHQLKISPPPPHLLPHGLTAQDSSLGFFQMHQSGDCLVPVIKLLWRQLFSKTTDLYSLEKNKL